MCHVQVRASIKSLFPERDCAALVRPMLDEAKLARMDALPYEQLRPEFRKVRVRHDQERACPQLRAARRRALWCWHPASALPEAVVSSPAVFALCLTTSRTRDIRYSSMLLPLLRTHALTHTLSPAGPGVAG